MFFQQLKPDNTILFYEGNVAAITSIFGSRNTELANRLKDAGHSYRRRQDRQAYDGAVDKLLASSSPRSTLQPEVIAQYIRTTYAPSLRGKLTDYPVLQFNKTASDPLREVFTHLFEWRNFSTSKIINSRSVGCFVGSGFATNSELKTIITVINKFLAAPDQVKYAEPEQIANLRGKFLPLLTTIQRNGTDLLSVSGGYVPKRLKLSDW